MRHSEDDSLCDSDVRPGPNINAVANSTISDVPSDRRALTGSSTTRVALELVESSFQRTGCPHEHGTGIDHPVCVKLVTASSRCCLWVLVNSVGLSVISASGGISCPMIVVLGVEQSLLTRLLFVLVSEGGRT
jgi:hypothetical protein